MHAQNFCNNCDMSGHSFHNCRKPLISNGIIAFRKRKNEKKYEYLIICRKHTFGYIDFMRGRYAINNKNHLMDIIFEMTADEKNRIINNTFDENWLELWGSVNNTYFKNEHVFAREKYTMLNRGVYIKNDFYNTLSLIDESKNLWKTPEWGFPKGRKNMNETSKECALREWCEETGMHADTIEVISNLTPYHEYVIGSNYQSYRDTYYLGKYNENTANEEINYQRKEISDAKWATLSEIKKVFRPYHKERMNIIEKVDVILEKWIVS